MSRSLPRRIAGQTMQNGIIEIFNGRLRDELLNETRFTSLAQARVALDVGEQNTTGSALTRNSNGARLPISPLPSIRAGI